MPRDAKGPGDQALTPALSRPLAKGASLRAPGAGSLIKPKAQSKIGATWDVVSDRRIAKLSPAIQPQVLEFVNAAHEQGIKLRVTQGHRSFDEQEKLYAQGRSEPGKIVTYARGGESSHNHGLAIDVVPLVQGQPDWNADWDHIGTLGKSFGLQWGGDWSGKKQDRPHFYVDLPE